MSVLGRVLAAVNRLPIGERAVRIGGDRLYVGSLDRWVAALGWKLGALEAAEHALLARIVGPGMVAVDVGANVGFHTLGLARRVGVAGCVYALEPDPDNFHLLERTVREAGLDQVRLVRQAAGECAGEQTLYLSPVNRGDHRLTPEDASSRRAVRVSTVVLDALLADAPRVDFVKIDVQGAELSVLRGLKGTLARRPPPGVLCELAPTLLRAAGAEPEACLAVFRAAGLGPHRLRRDGTPEPVTEREALAEAEATDWVNFYFGSRP
jgi:FkbM family methyltransferase